jgi:hypothetical protein
MGRDTPLGIDHAGLSDGTHRIAGDQSGQGLRRTALRAHQIETEFAVGRIRERLRRDCTYPSFGPRYDRTNREVMRLHCYAKLTGFGIARNDRIGVNWPPTPSRIVRLH